MASSTNLFGEFCKRMTDPPTDTESYYAAQIPFLNSIMNARDTKRYYDDYRKNTGIKEFKYPSRVYMSGNASGVVSSVASYGTRRMKEIYD